jgi:hypothetical protein
MYVQLGRVQTQLSIMREFDAEELWKPLARSHRGVGMGAGDGREDEGKILLLE